MLLAIDTAGPWVAICAGLQDEPGECARRATRLNHNETLSSLLTEAITSVSRMLKAGSEYEIWPGTTAASAGWTGMLTVIESLQLVVREASSFGR